MTTTLLQRLATVSLAILSVALLVCGVINYEQQGKVQLPDDGVSWLDSAEGVKAWIVTPNGSGYRAGVREGDLLKAIDGRAMAHAADAVQAIFDSGLWSKATYELERQGQPFETTVVITAQSDSRSIRGYLELVGLLYLGIGAFILVRRWSAPRSLHFYLFCLASFVLYTFHYTGKLNAFDWSVYWANVVAWVVEPALFLHFCVSFPERPKWLGNRPYAIKALYAVAGALLALHASVAAGLVTLPFPGLASRWLLDRLELGFMVACFAAGAVALDRSYRQAEGPLLKHQLKWLTRGTLVALIPFAVIYAVPYSLGVVPRPWMNLSTLSLILLPVTFGYAILHYRLMDVDIIFRRGLAYTLATAAIAGCYFAVIALFADVFRNHIGITSHTGWIVAIVVTAVLFQPAVNWIQARLERTFNRQRYDYRRTLLDFARESTSEVNADRLLDQVTHRLAETLDVERVAVFRPAGSNKPNEFVLVKSLGLAASGRLDLSFLDPGRAELRKGYLFFDSVRKPLNVSPAARATIERLDLHYYLPFKAKERTLGYLGLGKTRHGDFLSSEDIDLLHTICGQVAIALENTQLYRSLEQRALQYQALKDFNENIIESINAGVLAFNVESRVEAWNSAMEKLYGLERREAVGKKLEEIFPPELLAELGGSAEPAVSLYKFPLATRSSRRLIVNVSMAPLVGRDGKVLGRLLIFNDLTERVNLEDQLAQAEKLSSIGLLAAGVAHEVNTPLAVITSQAQMLMKQPAGEPPKPTLEKIIKASFRASEIVNSLLKFSRVSGSELSEMDMNKVIRETLSLVDPMLRASRISLNLQLTPSLPPVYGNYGKLQQIFMNLVMNARDAMPRGGELTLSTECEDSTLHVEVTDNGVGISPEHLNKIFDPFFTTKSTSRGTGLGLAVTYGLIREHSGKIQVESVVGRGTTFRLEFPLARKAVNVS